MLRSPLRSLILLCGLSLAGTVSSQAADDGLEVEGLRGQLPRGAAERVIGPRTDDFIACVTSRRSGNELLGGHVDLQLIIGSNGRVRVSRLATSAVGDTDAERCIVRIGTELVFPRPTGGDAEVTERLDFPLDADVRPPVDWREDRVRGLSADFARIAQRCRLADGSVRITAYVGRSGRALASGGFATAPSGDDEVSCIATAVRGLTFPDPGSYPAKVTFEVRGVAGR